MKNVLVAGGAGFIGSHLCDRFLRDGYRVTAIDDLCTGNINNLRKCFDSFPDRFSFIEHDVSFPYTGLYEKFNFIYHLASPASPKWYSMFPLKTIKSNVYGAFNLLEIAKYNNCPIFYSSTSEVYGDPLQHPQKESYLGNVNCVGPRSNYDESKRCAETIFYEYNKQYNVDVKIARFFNTYGPRMSLDDGRVISNFIVAALKNEDLVINGDGSQTRSFMYVDDLIDGILKFSDSNLNGPLNLGNPTEFTILELANLVIQKTQSKSKVIFAPKLQDDPVQRKPDITKATTHLDWTPKIPLYSGIDKCIDYFSEELKSSATCANVL